MLHYKTIDPGTLQLLKDLQADPLFKETRLVGGTALALQLGHRQSIDLDIFGNLKDLSSQEIQLALAETHSTTEIKESKHIHIYKVDGIKVDFVNFPYSWIDNPVVADGIILAGIKDIAAMKIAAIVGRGTKKDFIDLHFLLKRFSLQEILDFYMQKYPDGNLFIALKSLTYFADAEADVMPKMFEDANWDLIKSGIRKDVSSL